MQKKLFQELQKEAEQDYRAFTTKLNPHAPYPILGVRIPTLRRMAKDFIKHNDVLAYLEHFPPKQTLTFEEYMLGSFILAYAPKPLLSDEVRWQYIEKYLPYIQDWSLCDSFVASIHAWDKNTDFYVPRVQKLLDSQEPFTVRFAIVAFAQFAKDAQLIEPLLKRFATINLEHYYVQMGMAWTLSTLFLRAPEQVYAFLTSNHISPNLQRMTKRKILESRRTPEAWRPLIASL